jgi:N-acetylneuraminate synthase
MMTQDYWSSDVFVIAEAGVNHNGDLQTAFELVDVAAEAGADAVKFQTFQADKLVTKQAPKADYQKQTTDADESQHEMLRRLELSPEDHHALLERCEQRDILFMSTPFDEASADFLAELGVPLFKISSGDLTNLPFLRHVSDKGLPMIISTGMAWLAEVEEAVRCLEDAGVVELAILHCVSQYPAEFDDANLRAMHTLGDAFGYPVGYSDHTRGVALPIAATAMGARIIEKHFTLDRTLPGPDHRASLEPDELGAMVDGIRATSAALGDGRKRPVAAEISTAQVARKSIVAARDIAAGETLEADALSMRRPGTGLASKFLPLVEGRVAAGDISAGTLIDLELLR